VVLIDGFAILVAEEVFEAVEPTDMSAALIRRERFR